MGDISLQVRLKEFKDNHLQICNSILTLWTAERRVANARVLVAPKVEEGTAIVPVQKYALVDHSLNNVCRAEHQGQEHLSSSNFHPII